MEVIFLLGAVQAFFLASLIPTKKQNLLSDKILFVWLVILGVLLLDHYLEMKEIVFRYPHLLGLTYTLPLLIGPALYLYILSLTIDKGQLDMFQYLHFIPFVVFTLFFLFDYYFLGAEAKLAYYHQQSEVDTSLIILITEVFLIFSPPLYAIISLFRINKHQQEIADCFSYTERINLNWLKFIVYFHLFFGLISLITNLFSDIIPVMPFWMGDSLVYATSVAYIFILGYFGIKQQKIYPAILTENTRLKSEVKTEIMQSDRDLPVSRRYQNSGLKEEEKAIYLEKLLLLMKKEKPYLDNKLSLKDLAGKMELSVNHISQIINELLHKNFFDFVNMYRVEEVKEKLSDKKFAHFSLLAIAYECGFNSKSAFNHIFKKITGQTPSEYQKNIEEN